MIYEFVSTLHAYTDEQWRNYAFALEPLVGRLSDADKREYYSGAVACAREQVSILREKWGEAKIFTIAEKEKMSVKLDETPNDGVFTTFATYTMPGNVTIYADTARATDSLIASEGLSEITGGVKTQDLLLSHEIFHHVENHTEGIYTRKKHICLFKLGPFENWSRLVSLGEIAAMTFAKELSGLACSPYIFDVLMLYAKNPQRAKQQFEMIQNICEGDRG